MASVTKMKPSQEPLDVEIGLRKKDRKAMADGLAGLLADSYTLLGKTHGFHWNVTGPHFAALHALFEQQYTDLHAAVDELAERIRALGFRAPGSLAGFLALTRLKEAEGALAAEAMLRDLAHDHELIARACHDLVGLCQKAGDGATEDLMNARIAVHQKAAWMLRASLAS